MSETYSFKYKLGRIYNTQLDSFHKDRFGDYCSGRGFYAYADDLTANAICIIPKGAKYYKARDLVQGRIIYHSNQIKIISVLD